MEVRDGVWTDSRAVAELLHDYSRGKSTFAICSSRAGTAIKRARQPRSGAHALVAVDGDELKGFLFARREEAFSICERILFMQVHFLVGRNCGRSLLRALRERTAMRITVPTWNLVTDRAATDRLMQSEGFRPFGTIYES